MFTAFKEVLDVVLHVLHVGVIVINLFAWIPKRLRRIHRLTIGLTAFSWVVLAPFFGLGFCFLTQWHWTLRQSMGEADLPPSYVHYIFEKVTADPVDPKWIDPLVGGLFILAAAICVWQWHNEMNAKRKDRVSP